MSIRTKLGNDRASVAKGSRKPSRRGLRPALESLEGRVVLSQILWNTTAAPTGGDFDTATNWVGSVVPGSNDDAVINLPGTGTVTHNPGNSDTIQSLTTNAATSLDLASGTLTLTTASTIGGSLNLSGGTIAGAGALTVNALNWTSGSLSDLLKATGSSTITGTSAKYLVGTLTNAGTIAYSGTGTIYGYSATAAIVNQAGATFDSQADGYLYFYYGGTFTNAGTLKKSGGTGTTTVGFTFNNTGTVEGDSGTISLTGSFSNFSGTTLTGGNYVVAGTLMFPGANIVTNAAGITLNGASSAIVNSSSVNALANLATNAAGGSFSLQGGRNFTTAGAFGNAGSVTVGGTSTFTSTGAYTQSGGSTNLGGGTLASGQTVALNGGTLNGIGTVAANVSNTGAVVNPGGVGVVGTLGVSGSYTQGAGGTLNLELGGPSAGQYDVFAVSGAANLGGTLNVSLLPGYAPGLADSLTPLTFGSRAGDFATANYPTLGGGAVLTHDYQANALHLGVTANITPQIQVTQGGLLYNRKTHHFLQAVTITNTSSTPFVGPVSLVLDGLTGATLVGANGVTSQVGQAGSSYVNIPLSSASFGVGQSVTIYLEFDDPSFATISYTARILAGAGSR